MKSLEILNKAFGEDNVDADHNGGVIRLNPFDIEDEFGNSHLIQGMWIRFMLRESSDKIFLHDLEGIRTKQTPIENSHCYFHSHLPSCNLTNAEWSDFCTGQGSFGMEYIQVTAGVEADHFEFFIQMFKNFLSFEDNSNPYKRISEILPISVCVDRTPGNSALQHWLREPTWAKELKFNNQYHLVDCVENHSVLLSNIDLPSNYKCYKINGNYVDVKTPSSDTRFESKEVFVFKGETIYTELLPNPETQVIADSLERYVNPFVFQKISNIINNELKFKLLQEQNRPRINARSAYSENIRQCSEQDQILMFQNL